VEDVRGAVIAPGFIDGHCHIESTMLTPAEFARTVAPLGTTAAVTDPHEMANVLGVPGIRYMLEASEGLPLTVYVMVPPCVPASAHESPYMPLEAVDLAPLLAHERVLGIAEVMNFPAVIGGDAAMLAKVALGTGRAVDGHAPGVSGDALNAYLAAGVDSDHECTTVEEALEKRRLGMWIMIRQGTTTRNLAALLPLVVRYGPERCMFVTDDRTPASLLAEGHVNALVKTAVDLGLAAHQAICLASWNVAQRFGLRGHGAVAPGYRADLLVLDDLRSFRPRQVYHRGRLVAVEGQALGVEQRAVPPEVLRTVHVAPLGPGAFALPAPRDSDGKVRVVRAIEGQALTGEDRLRPTTRGGWIVADPARDLAKVAVVERHHATGRVGVGLVTGFGLRRGAFASSVGHDAHNITVAGISENDMATAVGRLAEIGGGLVVVEGGTVRGELALPIAGLMSDRSAAEVAAVLAHLDALLAEQGVTMAAPFMTLSFLPLSVIPALKITDRGLVDVTTFKRTTLEIDD
jgi:adenine deaminase